MDVDLQLCFPGVSPNTGFVAEALAVRALERF
jgi:hypothetical protein